MLGHGSGLPRCALDRAHDALIGSAAADVRAQVLDDLLARRFGFCLSRSASLMIFPDLQEPHFRHCSGGPGLRRRCDESADKPSIVVTDLPAISDIWVWHENARLPSICTMQAPHRPVPQPNLVPVSLRSSRITHNNGVVGGASVDAALPFTVKLMAMVFLP